LDVAARMSAEAGELEEFAGRVLADGIKSVVVLGMGGSSLAPEVFAKLFGPRQGLRTVEILDSTYPPLISETLARLSLPETLFIVSSKSGRTVETLSQAKFFYQKVRAVKSTKAGAHFVAITDEGSDLQRFAAEREFRRVFVNPSDIGGRYSALSYFGLVPASFTGVSLTDLLAAALRARETLAVNDPAENSAAQLGALWAAGAQNGRDKLTFVADDAVAPFVPWVEQLVAESTGKEGVGVAPIEGEPAGALGEYGVDRLFVFLEGPSATPPDGNSLRAAVAAAHVPHMVIRVPALTSLGFEFLRMEVATAAAGYLLGINPFDEPNVQESKDNTNAILGELESGGAFPEAVALAEWDGMRVIDLRDPAGVNPERFATPEKGLRKFFTGLRNDSYVAILCYFAETEESEAALAQLRRVIRQRFGVATLRGYGPRYLHSIGQLYKGGAAQGHFITLTHRAVKKLPIPGVPFTFNELISAQAIGDAQALQKRNFPLIALDCAEDPIASVNFLAEQIERIFEPIASGSSAE
ncbi:MAG TPA: hypothetical protein VLB27_09050, partial [candidate division Zixibacteria bacterium]|nr:hypothetical protein [candidate division Zixibacteria bacterium]